MAGAGWIRVPVGDDAARWATRGRGRNVLFVVHNVTAATRLLDVLPLFHDEFEVQLLATCPGSSAFEAGLAELLAQTGVRVMPWEQAVTTPVALAVSASFGGQLWALSGKLAVLSHGIGYTKRLATPDTRHPTVVGGSERSDPVFGMSPQWLLDEDGKPIADTLVLSHPEQYERLRTVCPEAAPTAVVAGDPCWDRMVAARPHRDRYRRALGLGRGQRLIVLNSTWNPESLFGDGGDDVLPSLLPRLTSELPADEYRLAAVLHPNIWHGHGPGQIRAWLDRARRAGLTLIDPLQGWRQALVAADLVIGDHGSVTYYAAALGTPVLLGAAPLAGLAPEAPVYEFVRTAPRLDPTRPLRPQVDAPPPQPPGRPAEFVSSAPGESAARLRRLFYGHLGLPEPTEPARLEPLPLPPYEPAVPTVPLLVLTRLTASGEVAVTRYAGPHPAPEGDGEAHLAVHEDTRETDRLALADVVFRYGDADDPRFGSPALWTAEVLDRHPYCALAAYVTGPGSCVVRTRAGALLNLTAESGADADPAGYASALHAWVGAGKALEELFARGLRVRMGRSAHHVRITPA
ncbi:hypothetical protein [Streptomyces sp. WM6386]|uniref:hypothetical protein n=1 Tax=Streptomyces sp. WM6386 TaxID=1415558 RepID=UPI000619588B|nr:hypothetical protein [Streptomyces sp. WM6386]KKD09779.1 hypothetical protein TN53_00310 [Streptomyces sp. WM6386]